MTCVSGYDIIKKRVPTGLKVTTKQVDLCEAVRKVLGQPQGDAFVKSSDAICKCFPRLEQLNTTAQFKSLSQGIMSLSNGKVADEIFSLNTCLQNGGIDLQHNLDEVKGSIQSGPGFSNSQMDEYTYPKLIAGIKSCQQDVCNSTLITGAITNGLSASGEADGSLRGTLNRWQAILSSIKSDSTGLNQLLPKFMSYVESAQVQFDEINDMCTELDSCKGPHVSEFLQKVASKIAATKYLGTLRFPSTLASTLDNILKRVLEALDLPRYLEGDAAVALFKNNKIKTTKDLFQLLPKIKTLHPISKDINTRLVPIKEFLPNNQTFAISTYTEQQQLLSIPFQDIE
ncbi:uncharacterized protein FIESC28_07715 [Fusarium coffeatum]|uniref:Uncharacterized protein n=1 Tax=Fusarium coffeatum TaxID=231269 RepID=A0A366RBD5_9HYPO|nr:uncharacterized protein FIESC28_07715 [Fusarium coffeatum]RBR14479.1 hypothetical protein FIESC28_07715 [Fusarium coffeatum]